MTRSRIAPALALGLGLSVCAALPSPGRAQSSTTNVACDARLKPVPGRLGYGPRGDRCEGLYEQLVSPEGALQVVSFAVAERPTVVPEKYVLRWPAPSIASKPASSKPVAVPAPARAVTLRAAAVADRRFFRMDATTPRSAFDWDTSLLREVGAQAQQLGVIATFDATIGGVPQTVYLPVDLGQVTGQAPRKYTLWLSSPANLSDAWLSVDRLGTDGAPAKTVIKDRPLGHAHYIAMGPAAFTIDLTKEDAGLYQIRVGATYVRKGTSSLTMVMRHE